MLFSSILFLYYFLPIVMLLYFAVPKCLKNGVLLLASLVFYAWGEPKYVILMIASIVIGYVSGLLIEAFHNPKWKKVCLVLSLTVCLGLLAYFKYAEFFLENFAAITGITVSISKIALPIGISFYMFQILSYIVDVYRGETAAQKNIVHLAAYVAMFPQLIAGPIVRYVDIAKELENRTHSIGNFALGARRFIVGLVKKILIANTLGELCDIFRASDEKAVLFYWLYAVAFGLHIYFDFSGYSDMAIGLGRIFGFTFLENFNYPYISKSITEFWRRWHISLGSWFRDYVYIPLGGNRVSKPRWFFNIFVVWMLTGFWHGAAWNFVVWGLVFAVFLVIEKLWLLKWLEKAKVWNHVYVVVIVLIAFVIFNAADMKEAFSYIGGMFGAGGIPVSSPEFVYYLKSYSVTLVLAVIGATPFVKNAINECLEKQNKRKVVNVLEPIALVAFLMVMTAYLVDGSFHPFLYFRF